MKLIIAHTMDEQKNIEIPFANKELLKVFVADITDLFNISHGDLIMDSEEMIVTHKELNIDSTEK